MSVSHAEGWTTDRTLPIQLDSLSNEFARNRVVALKWNYGPHAGCKGQELDHRRSHENGVQRHEGWLDGSLSRISAFDSDAAYRFCLEILCRLREIELVRTRQTCLAWKIERHAPSDRTIAPLALDPHADVKKGDQVGCGEFAEDKSGAVVIDAAHDYVG